MLMPVLFQGSAMATSNPDDAVDMDVLTTDDYLTKLAPRWVRIGMDLGQEACVRDLIQLKDTPPSNECVAIVLQKWVESCKEVSWTKLCSVLRHSSVGLEEVAEQIQQVRLKTWVANTQVQQILYIFILFWIGTCTTKKGSEDDSNP